MRVWFGIAALLAVFGAVVSTGCGGGSTNVPGGTTGRAAQLMVTTGFSTEAWGPLYLVNVDGSATPELLTPSGLDASIPQWSPHGDTVAFRSLDLVNFGFQPSSVSGTAVFDVGANAFAWSPDGRSLVCAGSGGVFVVDTTTGQSRTLIPAPPSGTGWTLPAWSPDGHTVAAVYVTDTLQPPLIYLLDAQTGSTLGIIITAAGTFDVEGLSWLRGSNGGSLVYKSGVYPLARLYRVAPLGGANSVQLASAVNVDQWASSPDGARIALTYGPVPNGSSALYQRQLGMLSVTSAGPVHYLDTIDADTLNFPPSWSPDGTRFAISPKVNEVYIVDAATGQMTLVSNLPPGARGTVGWRP